MATIAKLQAFVARTSSNKDLWLDGIMARCLVMVTILNLNGLSFMLFGINRLFSAVMLICSLVILVRIAIRLDQKVAWFLALVVGYMVFGGIFSLFYSNSSSSLSFAVTTVGTLLLTLSLVAYIQQQDTDEKLEAFLHFVRNTTLISVIAILASPILYMVFLHPPPSASYRAAGFFANPNEAGVMCAFAMIMILTVPFRSRALQIAFGVIIVSAVLVSLSRSAMSMIGLICLFSIGQAGRKLRYVAVFAVLTMLVVHRMYPTLAVEVIELQPFFELSSHQIYRLTTLLGIVNGEFDSNMSNSRFEMWTVSVEKALSVFPFGTGLGSFHLIEGGVLGARGWFGSHNAYLMVWGESGALMLAIMIVFSIKIFVWSYKSVRPWMGFYLSLLFVIWSLASHGTLSTRFMTVVFALIIAMPALGSRAKDTGQ